MTEKKPYRGAKIPSPDNSIRVRRTVCDICSAGCNIDAYIENGKVIKVTGCKDPAFGNGYLCARGHANRPYIYHEERIKTPLRRCGGVLSSGTRSKRPRQALRMRASCAASA